MPLSDNRAFTLIELVVVTVLISIMLVVAIPRLGGGLLSDNTDETSRWIMAAVRQLKEKAVSNQKIYLLNVSIDGQRLWVSEAEAAESEAETAREKGHALPSGVAVDQVTFSQTARFASGTVPIAFYPQGYSDRAVIHLKTGRGERLACVIEPFLPDVELVEGNHRW